MQLGGEKNGESSFALFAEAEEQNRVHAAGNCRYVRRERQHVGQVFRRNQ